MRTRFLLRSATRIVAVVGVGRSYGPTARTVALTSIPSFLICSAVAPAAFAQSVGTGGMALDGRPHPGSPITGWTGNISPADPYSAGPNMGAWITKAGLIHSRSEVGVGELNGKMYVLGGYADGNVAQPLNEEYDPVRDMWRERAPLPQGANHIAVVGLEGKLYAIGGFVEQNYHATADVWAYDPAKDTWAAVAPLPQPLGSMAVAAVDGVIHAVGGAGGTTIDNRHTIAVHYIYHPRTNRWSDSVPLPFPREHFNLIVLSGKLYAIGGRMENFSQNTQTIFSLDLHDQGARWTALPLMPIARSGTQAAVLDNKIFVFGGERFGGVFNSTEMFDPATQRWSELTPMPVGRHGTGAVTLGNMIYIPAGGPLNGGEAQTNANQAFTYP
jgi:N-acetylneuraminic acid mutarotase